MSAWFVYIARCKDGSLYTGIARDVAARLMAHNAGKGARYTRGRAPVTLRAKTRCSTQGDALRLERAIKALRRNAKIALAEVPRALVRFARQVRTARLRRPKEVPTCYLHAGLRRSVVNT